MAAALSSEGLARKITELEDRLIRKYKLLENPELMSNLQVNISDLLSDITYTEELLHKLDDVLGAKIQAKLDAQ